MLGGEESGRPTLMAWILILDYRLHHRTINHRTATVVPLQSMPTG